MMPHCKALTDHLCVLIRNEIEFGVCCRFAKQPQTFPVKFHTYNDFKTSEFYQNVIAVSQDGWHPGCVKCQEEEIAGTASMRQAYNRMMTGSDKVEFIEVSLSNSCNLTCKMCSDKFSSKWATVLDKNPGTLDKWFTLAPYETPSIEKIFDGVDLSNLSIIKYLGGEPTITTEIHELIEFLEKHRNLNEIKFRCNTNATFFSPKFLKTLSKFKSSDVHISLDGIGPLCNYIRTGEHWEVVNDVIHQWKEVAESNNIRLTIFNTTQAYNLHQYNQIMQYATELNIPFLSAHLKFPRYLSYAVLPYEYRSEVLSDLPPSMATILRNTPFNPALFEEFKEYTLKLDRVLNTNIEQTIPELFKYF